MKRRRLTSTKWKWNGSRIDEIDSDERERESVGWEERDVEY